MRHINSDRIIKITFSAFIVYCFVFASILSTTIPQNHEICIVTLDSIEHKTEKNVKPLIPERKEKKINIFLSHYGYTYDTSIYDANKPS